MFNDSSLIDHIETSSTVSAQSLIIAEWNLNNADNILEIGNYLYDPQSTTLTNSFALETSATVSPKYYGATDSQVSMVSGFDSDDNAQSYVSQSLRNKFLFSLSDCFKKFRPRSGINKLVYFNDKYISPLSQNITDRPRYYIADKDDKFKYWTSARTTVSGTGSSATTVERGISKKASDGKFYITDAAPFIVYKNEIPANRVVVKMQTNVGINQNTAFQNSAGTFADPFYGDSNKTVPVTWRIDYLDNSNTWNTLKSFTSASAVGIDGYVELAYGITNFTLPSGVTASQIYHAGQYSDFSLLPVKSIKGYTYLVPDPTNATAGTFYVCNGGQSDTRASNYSSFVPTYGWNVKQATESNLDNYLEDLTSPPSYGTTSVTYRDFQYISGLRIVVDTMQKNDVSFDLIELSPRLASNLTGKTVGFQVKRPASDIGSSGMPVGQLLAATGSLDIFDYDLAFSSKNKDSILNLLDSSDNIVTNFATKNLQIKMFEIIYDNDQNCHIVPMKTMYSEGFPQVNDKDRSLSISLRDMYSYFESIAAPEVLMVDQYFSYVVAVLLDSIGFTNYSFKRVPGEVDQVIPYFFVAPNTSVAQVLSDLASSTQTAMFFDEDNNLILMSKDYMMPSETDRSVDIGLYGSVDSSNVNVYENYTESGTKLSNIIDIASQNSDVFNDGKINYVTRYIQRTTGTIAEQSLTDIDQSWIYKPVLLWEVSPTENTKSINEEVSNQSKYTLSAIALNSDLPNVVPTVVNGVIVNNTMDFGESVFWLSRYNGYFYANGEIIRYDAVQYSVNGAGNVWVTSVQDYQKYFASIPFNGKLYPTGLVRIFAEPYYDSTTISGLKEGAVASHGRMQFGTGISNADGTMSPVYHNAGLNSYWNNPNNIRTIQFKSDAKNITSGGVASSDFVKYSTEDTYSSITSKNSRVSYKIKNLLASQYRNETLSNGQRSIQTPTVQSSALILTGSNNLDNPFNYTSYVYKSSMPNHRYFGTRMRIIGEASADTQKRLQEPIGSSPYYTVGGKNIGGSGGGLGIMINPKNGSGYYLEVSALTDLNIKTYTQTTPDLHNIFFYKVGKATSGTQAVAYTMYEGMAPIIVNDGTFAGQGRVYAEKSVSVYDIAIEYENKSFGYRFHIYINNKYITSIDDDNPLKEYNNMGLFVRGTSKLMFENIYSLGKKSADVRTSDASVLNSSSASSGQPVTDSLRRYSLDNAMQSTYLQSLGTSTTPTQDLYYDEFGTIMREMAYFNIKYDKAYPALQAKIAPTFNNMQGYSIAGFTATPYGAEFMVFNTTDGVLSLDETSGNYLRILGITFTQQSEHVLTMDDYFSKKGDLSNPTIGSNSYINQVNNKVYTDIKSNRLTYGKKEFAISAPYIQSPDMANNLMAWVVGKLTKPRKSVGVHIFANPAIRLGDILTIDYTTADGQKVYSSNTSDSEYTRFVVYSIDYSRGPDGPSMTLYLSEVV